MSSFLNSVGAFFKNLFASKESAEVEIAVSATGGTERMEGAVPADVAQLQQKFEVLKNLGFTITPELADYCLKDMKAGTSFTYWKIFVVMTLLEVDDKCISYSPWTIAECAEVDEFVADMQKLAAGKLRITDVSFTEVENDEGDDDEEEKKEPVTYHRLIFSLNGYKYDETFQAWDDWRWGDENYLPVVFINQALQKDNIQERIAVTTEDELGDPRVVAIYGTPEYIEAVNKATGLEFRFTTQVKDI
ncbi:MAG: hypothetical protein U0V74_00650 [Chitinophagales bacterium]